MKTSCCSSSSSSLFVVTALAISGVALTTTSAEDAASLPTNTAQLCNTNAVGTTCPSGANLPDVACCASGVTGAFFNACCPADFVGINMGPATATYTKQFAMDMVTGTGMEEEAPAICGVSADGTGCPVLQTPENEAAGNQPLILPAGVEGPCVATTTTTCSETAGTCTASDGSTFDVCCPTCATGTYLPGQSCNVILPDPAACGINIMSKDNNETDVTDVDVGAEESADDANATANTGADADADADTNANADADADADADTESTDPLIVLSTDVPTVAPVEVPTSMVPTSTVDDGDEGTPSPTLKEGDAPSVTAPSEVVQPIFEAPVAPAPISAAPGRGRRDTTVVAIIATTTTTIALVVAAVVAAV